MDKELERLMKEYENIPIPTELDSIIERACKPHKKKRKRYIVSLCGSFILIFMATIKLNPTVATAMSKVPIVKEFVELITFNEFKEEKNNSSIDIKTPAIKGLENKELEKNINNKYLEESKSLYREFKTNAFSVQQNLAINSDFEKVTETSTILSIRRTTSKTQASGDIQKEFVTLDKSNQILITLKSLFKNNDYIFIISENIKQQMKKQMELNPENQFFIKEEPDMFSKIKSNQQFYINKNHKLVISFNKYEVAPGYMGAVEFEIPTEIISDILVGEKYIN
ncbi:DUF3298 domain-containing protein [Bacillus cereus]|uniref:DUF3298 and DUF4163 domain-containing protein n=1 Tax=Bacillus cereus TaxID=1396 RepID=UPI0024052C42|nr:DUF3298 and DUF4163 domain-containing protein [Bacillus cereus]MDF9612874.1 DUF3298 domain-containing protein [Bacillus cereus]